MMKHYGEDADNARQNNRISNYIGREESRKLEKVKQWREYALIKFLLLYIIAPMSILSLLAFTVPYIYTIVPVYQSETCWQQFADKGSFHVHLDTVPCPLKLVNSLIFVILNWGEVVGFAALFWMIRNIKNELNVKREVQAVLVLWGIFSIIYFSFQLAL